MTDPIQAGGSEKDRPRLLLVEDDAIISLAEAKALRSAGYEVIAVLSGEAAIEKIAASGRDDGHPVDLILMDVDLGRGIDGTEAARTILASHDIPIVFLSSHTEPSVVEKTERITNYGYILKSAGQTVIQASIKMAFRLHDAYVSLQRKELALKYSEEKYSKVFMASPFAIGITRGASGVFIDVNETFLRFFGWSRKEIIGRTGLELGLWRHAAERDAVLGRLRSERSLRDVDLVLRNKDGADRFGLGSYDYLEIDGEECVIAIIVDVTESRAVDLALKDKEAHYRVLFHDLSNAVVEEDFSQVKIRIDALSASGVEDIGAWFDGHPDDLRQCVSRIRILRFNEEYLRILNAPNRAAVANTLMPYVPDVALAVLKAEFLGLYRGDLPLEISCRNFIPDSDVEWLKLRLSIVSGHEEDWSSVLVTFTDVTREVKAEEALEALLEQKESLVRELEGRISRRPDGICR